MVFNVPVLDETFEIAEQLGQGGGGIIYKAYHKRLQKYVVVKQTKDRIKGVMDVRGEADILKRLHHTYLPQVYDFIIVGNDYYTVIDFVDGSSFDCLLNAKQVFSRSNVVKWAIQLCEALNYLHTNGILHSDIKPANIILRSEGDICLIDFNISVAFEQSATAIGMCSGYSPPEQCVRSAGSTAPKPLYKELSIFDDSHSTATSFDAVEDATDPLVPSERDNQTIPGRIDQRSDIYRCYTLSFSHRP